MRTTEWTSGICKANGIDVHYIRTGGDKPPIVLLHGLMLNGACWTPLARDLAEDYDIIMPDARGHENSSIPDPGYSYDNLASDVIGLIDVLKLTSPILLGHSMGGMTATVVASRNPNRLRGLILADPTFLTPQRQREVAESDVKERHLQILNRPRQDLLTEMHGRNRRRSPEIIELFANARFQTNIRAFEVLTPPNPNYIQLIKTLDIPSLLLIGDIDSIVSPELAKELAGLNQRLEVIQIPKAGHGLPFDQPEHFSTAVRTFLHSVST